MWLLSSTKCVFLGGTKTPKNTLKRPNATIMEFGGAWKTFKIWWKKLETKTAQKVATIQG